MLTKKIFLILPFIMVIFLVTCTKIPDTNFTIDTASGNSPLAIQFKDLSTNKPTQWNWDFGDGSKSTEQNPNHVYNIVGTYSVSLTTANKKGANSLSKTALIKVSPGPVERLEIQPKEASTLVGSSQRFSIKAYDQFNNEISDFSSSWSVTPDAGTIDGQGNYVAGNRPGTFSDAVKVEIKKEGVTKAAFSSVILRIGPLSKIAVTPIKTNLEIGGNQQFDVKATDRFDNEIRDASYRWSVKEGIGELNQTGLFTAGTKAGSFSRVIQTEVSKDGVVLSANADVVIKPGPFSGLTLEPQNTVLAINSTQHFIARPQDEFGNEITGIPVTWNITGAGTLKDGLFTAGTIAGKYNNVVKARTTQGILAKEATASITINSDPLEQVVVTPNPAEIGIRVNQQFVAYGMDQFGNKLSDVNFICNIREGGRIDSKGFFTAGENPGNFKDTIVIEARQGPLTRRGYASTIIVPDRIAFVSFFGSSLSSLSGNIFIMDADGTNISEVTKFQDIRELPSYLSVSPDGKKIVFGKLTWDTKEKDFVLEIWVVNIDGSGLTKLTTGITASWSPDGKKIVFSSSRDGNSEIYVMNQEGINIIRLTYNQAWDTNPAWSPDGKKIVFSSDRDGNYEIYMMDSDGRNLSRLTNSKGDDINPVWSPDGKKIAFVSDRDGDDEIFIMTSDGSNPTQLTNNISEDIEPSFSPDGNKIVFSSKRDGRLQVYLMESSGRNQTRITNSDSVDGAARYLPRKQGIKVYIGAQSPVITSQPLFQSVEEATAWIKQAVVRIRHAAGEGSGMIVDGGGYILTNNHVVENVPVATVILDDGQEFNGVVVGRDLLRDMAVLKIAGSNLREIKFGYSDQLKLGQRLIALGYPAGLEGSVTVTSGLFSASRQGRAQNMTWIQTDTALNPGNSGGPLIIITGEVIGMVTVGLKEIDGIPVTGISFAISSNTIKIYLSRLKAGEIITG